MKLKMGSRSKTLFIATLSALLVFILLLFLRPIDYTFKIPYTPPTSAEISGVSPAVKTKRVTVLLNVDDHKPLIEHLYKYHDFPHILEVGQVVKLDILVSLIVWLLIYEPLTLKRRFSKIPELDKSTEE